MSCFILNDQSTVDIAEVIKRVLDNCEYRRTFLGIFNGESLEKAFRKEYEQLFDEEVDYMTIEKVCLVLRGINYKAYAGRYNANEKIPKEILTLEAHPRGQYAQNPWQLLKTFECYLYQIYEDTVYGSPIFEALTEACDGLRKHLVESIKEYNEAKWG